MFQFFDRLNRVTQAVALVVLCLAHAPRLVADTSINAVFEPGEEINDIVGARYKFELRQNESVFSILADVRVRCCVVLRIARSRRLRVWSCPRWTNSSMTIRPVR